MRNPFLLGALVAACTDIAAFQIEGDEVQPIAKRTRKSAPAGINRHTGEPHKHSREIARHLRQQARGQ